MNEIEETLKELEEDISALEEQKKKHSNLENNSDKENLIIELDELINDITDKQITGTV